ncbi:MAG: N-acetylglucosamine kinase [Ferruginibacter sp.]|uniref:N-acetylglucosamine kinase n=1 Tax=Ferruginibacter sp. TaxID=1940288 RepID=UPI0026586B20|nr:N-acetylglucosamine kinase [Ferruginibacter sp.]MDB5276791.1 N-acetylglucosamine kinase [Ferruginibacter sp.]
MILVADSGSTKTSWCLINEKAGLSFFNTEGYNPYFVNSSYIAQSLSLGLPSVIPPLQISHIYFYGAGCFEDKTHIIKDALQKVFPTATLAVGLDLLGSARAVLHDQPGFAAILGTGTNSCLYDGSAITANIDSLGYLLGDEGSGFYIGRQLLGDYIREYMPAAVRADFFAAYGLKREQIMDRVYSEKLPNRYCAGFVQFISVSTADKEYTNQLVKNAFIDFFETLVTKYPNYRQYSFNCTGSVGYAFKDILSAVATLYGMKPGGIIRTPIEGLARYHSLQG